MSTTRQLGPFTVLDVSYNEPFGYFGANLRYYRILHNGRVIIKQADSFAHWPGAERTTLLLQYPGKESSLNHLHLLYDQGQDATIERVDEGDSSWGGDEQFGFGYPIHSNRRYFPRYVGANDAGFLLSIFPTKVVVLPHGPEGANVPWVQALAGIAPDGNAFAYADSKTEPGVLAVVNVDGDISDPQPISITRLDSAAVPGANPFEPLWRWFRASYRWEKDKSGLWRIMAVRSPPPISAVSAVEELFIDASRGYPACFDPKNPACLNGWKTVQNREVVLGGCCVSHYAYSPNRQTRAFDTDVVAIAFSRSMTAAAGYQLLLDARPEYVTAVLEKRLMARQIPFARPKQCWDDVSFVSAVGQLIHGSDQKHGEIVREISAACEHGAEVLVTPSAAIAVLSAPLGRSWIYTLGRYNKPNPPAGDGAGA